MASSEYKLNYKGEEINRRLGLIDKLLLQNGGKATNLQITYSSILGDDNAVSVRWVNNKLLGFISLNGNSKERSISGDLYLDPTSKILTINGPRVIFTSDLANWAGYSKDVLSVSERSGYTQLNAGVWIKNEALSGTLDDYKNESDSPFYSLDLNPLGGNNYQIPKYRFAHLAQMPRHLRGDPYFQHKNTKDEAGDARYGYGIVDVYTTEATHRNNSSFGSNNNWGTGKYYILTLGYDEFKERQEDGTEKIVYKACTTNLAEAATTLNGYNITDAFIGDSKDDTDAINLPSNTTEKRTYTTINLGDRAVKVVRPGDIWAEANKELGTDLSPKNKLKYTRLTISQLNYTENNVGNHFDLVQPGTSLASYDIQDAYIGQEYNTEGNNIGYAGKIHLGNNSLYVLRPGDVKIEETSDKEETASQTGLKLTISSSDYSHPDTSKQTYVIPTKGDTLAHYGITDANFTNKTGSDYAITLHLNGKNHTADLLKDEAISVSTTGYDNVVHYQDVTIRGTKYKFVVAPNSADSAPVGGSLKYYGIDDTFTANYIDSVFKNTKIRIKSVAGGTDITSTTAVSALLDESKSLCVQSPQYKNTAFDEHFIDLNITKVQEAISADKATKLTTNAGNEKQPIYFNDGIPVACNLAQLTFSGSNKTYNGSTEIDKITYSDVSAMPDTATGDSIPFVPGDATTIATKVTALETELSNLRTDYTNLVKKLTALLDGENANNTLDETETFTVKSTAI